MRNEQVVLTDRRARMVHVGLPPRCGCGLESLWIFSPSFRSTTGHRRTVEGGCLGQQSRRPTSSAPPQARPALHSMSFPTVDVWTSSRNDRMTFTNLTARGDALHAAQTETASSWALHPVSEWPADVGGERNDERVRQIRPHRVQF